MEYVKALQLDAITMTQTSNSAPLPKDASGALQAELVGITAILPAAHQHARHSLLRAIMMGYAMHLRTVEPRRLLNVMRSLNANGVPLQLEDV